MIPSSEHDVRSSVSRGRVPAAVLVAVAGTWISTVVLLIVAIRVMVSGRDIFGAGVGAMLIIYASLVALVGWLAIKGRSSAQGLLVASGMLHLVVLVSTQRSGGPAWFWGLAIIPATVIVASWCHDLGPGLRLTLGSWPRLTRLLRVGVCRLLVLVVEPGEEGSKAFHGNLKFRVEVDKVTQLIGEPGEGDLLVSTTVF